VTRATAANATAGTLAVHETATETGGEATDASVSNATAGTLSAKPESGTAVLHGNWNDYPVFGP
jgi:hypothetical protein